MKKYSRKIPLNNLKLLLARSGNQCAFSNCSHPVFDNDGLLVAQLCHIEAVSPKGQRYNPAKTNREINSFDNLLFLCYRHHKVTDNVSLYTVEKMKEIKADHESKFKEHSYVYSKEVLINLEKEIQNFWTKVEHVQSKHIVPELAVPIDSKKDILALIKETHEYLNHLTEVNSVLLNECKKTQFEYVCLAMPNLLTRLNITIDQLKIKYLEEKILNEPDNKNLLNQLKKARKNFENTAKYAILAD